MARRKKLSPEPFEINIDRLLENGRGSAIHEDARLQVHGALAGETVRARHLFGRRMRGQAESLEILRSSDVRVEPRCPHFGTCSACTLQHMDLPAQLEFKQRVMLHHLREDGGIEPQHELPPLQTDTWNYRRKARLSVRNVRAKERVLVGFRERDGRFVADMQECHILRQEVADRLPELSRLVGDLSDPDSVPQIEVTCGDDKCALIFRHTEPLTEVDLGSLREFARETGLGVLLQPGGPATVQALEPESPDLRYALPEFELEYRFEPLDFVQVNGALNQAMIHQAIALLELRPQERVLDLFCGLGNFTLPLARQCLQVTGIEGDEGLVQRARENAARNGVANALFMQSDLYSGAGEQEWSGESFDKVLLDPPRSGAEPVLAQVAETGAKRILYVSCNPVTLGRDAGTLVREHGYTLAAAGAMDMFPHTAHVESMALFEKA